MNVLKLALPIAASATVGAIAVPVVPGAIMGAVPSITHFAVTRLTFAAVNSGCISHKAAHTIRLISMATLIIATPVVLTLLGVATLPIIAISGATVVSIFFIQKNIRFARPQHDDLEQYNDPIQAEPLAPKEHENEVHLKPYKAMLAGISTDNPGYAELKSIYDMMKNYALRSDRKWGIPVIPNLTFSHFASEFNKKYEAIKGVPA